MNKRASSAIYFSNGNKLFLWRRGGYCMDENFAGLNKNNNPDLVNKTKQEIVLRNREYLKINDVTDVVSFDENGVILESGYGSISVDGAELRVTRLATGSGEIEIEGKIGGVVFFEAREKPEKKGVFGRRRT